MPRIHMLRPRVVTADLRSAKPPEKEADPFYLSPEFRNWREIIVSRAGRRCESINPKTGQRCTKAEPHHRMFADHIIEVKDGGAKFDPANGQCLCGSHHGAKTHAERRARASLTR